MPRKFYNDKQLVEGEGGAEDGWEAHEERGFVVRLSDADALTMRSI
jgi:hypothetical protein